MKDGYRYQDGKVLVTDYSNNSYRDIQVRHYQDNIEDILITENVLEDLDKLYDSVGEIIKEDRRYIYELKGEIPTAVFLVFLMTFVMGGPLSLLLALIGIKHIFTLILFFLITGGILCKFNILPSIKKIKELEKQLNGEYLSLEIVEKEIEKNQNRLKELEEAISRKKLDNPSDNVDSLRRGDYIQLDYVEKLKQLREYLSYCYVVGSDNFDFLKLYNIQDFTSFVELMKVDPELRNTFEKNEYKVLKRKFADRIKDR